MRVCEMTRGTPTGTCQLSPAAAQMGESEEGRCNASCGCWGQSGEASFQGRLEVRDTCPEDRKEEEREDRVGSREDGFAPRQWVPHATLRPGAESRPRVTMPANLGPLASGGATEGPESKRTIKYPHNVGRLRPAAGGLCLGRRCFPS